MQVLLRKNTAMSHLIRRGSKKEHQAAEYDQKNTQDVCTQEGRKWFINHRSRVLTMGLNRVTLDLSNASTEGPTDNLACEVLTEICPEEKSTWTSSRKRNIAKVQLALSSTLVPVWLPDTARNASSCNRRLATLLRNSIGFYSKQFLEAPCEVLAHRYPGLRRLL